jgi:hypothetical protein
MEAQRSDHLEDPRPLSLRGQSRSRGKSEAGHHAPAVPPATREAEPDSSDDTPLRQRRRQRPANGGATRLKVGWLTPFGPRSDVGTFSRAVLRAAAGNEERGLDLIPLVNQNGPTYFHPGPLLTLGGGVDEDVLQSFDAVVYNIGNNVENHGAINRLALRCPGIVVVHDLVMQHYVAWETFERLRDPTVYADLMASHYGARGLDALAASRICAARARPRYAPWDSAHATAMPLVEPFVATAAAVIVHSAFAEERVRGLTSAPLLRLGLPHDQKPELADAEVAAWAEQTCRRERVTFAAFGHIGQGKCLPMLVQAFHEEPELARRTSLVIAGYPTDRALADELADTIRALDLSDCVRLELGVSVERLQQLKREADVFVNLRWPNTEAAAGSLVEQLNTGKPVMLYPTGCYAEVPESAAIRVAPMHSVPALARAMLGIAGDAERRVRIGAAGRAHTRRLSAAAYADGLAAFVRDHRDLLRDRAAMNPRLRALDPARLAERVRRADVEWARGVAMARDRMAAILDGGPAVSPRPFLELDDAALRGFIVLGLFRLADLGGNPALLSRLEHMIGSQERLACFRTVRQALAVREAVDGGVIDVTALGTPEPDSVALLACLGPEVLAAALYVLVLGRVPAPGEPAGYALRLARGEPTADVVREMTASDEFHARRLPADAAERLRAGARLADEALRLPNVRAPQLEAGAVLCLGVAAPVPEGLLLGPWNPPEATGVWSAGGLARLALRAPPDLSAGARLRLRVRLAMRPGEPPRQLRAVLDGRVVQTVEVPSGEWRDVLVPLAPSPPPSGEQPDGAAVVIALDAGRAVAAREAGGGEDDRRRLGVMLAELELVPPDAHSVEAGLPLLDLARPLYLGLHAPPPGLLAEGWHGVEPGGVWSTGNTARLRFAVPPLGGAARAVCLRLARPGAPALARREVAFALDGARAGMVRLHRSGGETEALIPLPARDGDAPSCHELAVAVAGPFRPSDGGASEDGRLLGVMLLGVELRLAAPATAANGGGVSANADTAAPQQSMWDTSLSSPVEAELGATAG